MGAMCSSRTILYFVVPEDVRSILVSVEQGSRLTAVNQLFLNGEALIDLSTGLYPVPFFHEPVEMATVTLPINADTSPEAGCLAIDPIAYDTSDSSAGSLHVVTRRDDAEKAEFQLNLIIVGSTAITDDELSAAIRRMNDIYAAAGAPKIGETEAFDLEWPNLYLDAEGPEIARLKPLSSVTAS